MATLLSKLVCGRWRTQTASGTTDLGDIFQHISDSVDHVFGELQALTNAGDTRLTILGPFLARSLLELCATALIGRLDPMRLLVIRKVQQHAAYDRGTVWKSTIRWQGDVVAEKVSALWDKRSEYKDMTKALLGDYYEELFWRPALTHIVDRPEDGPPSTWLAQLKSAEPGRFTAQKRTEISQLYTALSKGVHHEFVMPPGALYDRQTVIDLVQRAIHVIADLAFVSHFISHAPYRLRPSAAIRLLRQAEDLEVIQ